jgi:hypothetical protein
MQETKRATEVEIPAVQNIQETTVPETQKAVEIEAPTSQDTQEATVSETQTPPPPAASNGDSESE